MDKTLQDHVWSILPKEFKEEVKKMHQEYVEYRKECEANPEKRGANSMAKIICMNTIFGHHHLTSDAEGEEMLTVPRKPIIQAYEKSCAKRATKYDVGYADCLYNLFGSKCLPDEGTDCTPVEVGVAENTTTSNIESLEPKSAEPKFKEGDIVRYRYDGKLYTVVCKTGKYYYALRQPDGAVMIHDVLESDLEPLTEQEVTRHVSVKEACGILGVDESEATKLVKSEPIETCTETCTDDCSSPDHFVVKDKMVDNIIKDGFRNERRLNIAAMAMQGMLSNTTRFSSYEISDLVRISLNCADALIKKAEGGSDE